MAKCDLSIELDEPQRVYSGGEKITGVVHVDVDDNVNCKSLELKSGWRTHGRGNVDSGDTETISVFAGQWTAGQRESYRFELEAGGWPASYHGSLINIDHYIDARAKIPWAFDPKTSAEFVVRPESGPEDAKAAATEITGCIGYGIVGFVIAMVGFGLFAAIASFAANPIIGIIFGLFAFSAGGFVALKYLLPQWLLGKVECELLSPIVAPGGIIKAKMAFRPKRSVSINAITAKLTGSEVCYSGSGSNRTRHANVFFDDQQVLESQTQLQPGSRREFDLEFAIPGNVPYSFNLQNNNLNWEINLRVDIPRWPDWSKTLKVSVMPDGNGASMSDRGMAGTSDPMAVTGEITFEETASHLWQLRDDPDQVDILVAAVLDMTFEIDTYVERRLLYSGDEDPHVYKDGYAVWARHSDPPLPLVLYIPHEMADEFEQTGRDLWRCRGTVVGWDHEHRRLQVKVLPNP